MWQVLKAELNYNKLILSIAYSIAIFFLIVSRYKDMAGIYGFSAVTSGIFIFSLILMGSESEKEKRDRFFMYLPLTLKQISMIRMFSLVLFQTGMFLLWSVVFFLDHFGHDNQAIWSMLVINALLYIMVSFIVVFHDLGFFHTVRYQVIYYASALLFFTVIALLLSKGYIKPEYISIGNKTQKTFLEALVVNSICVGMFYLSHKIFMCRKSYQS